VPEHARQVLADEANDARHRFLAAGAHVTDPLGEVCAAEFGPGPGAARTESPRGTDA
jgi:hypothetical protein